MGFNFETARFHIKYGPSSLFERVKYVMAKTDNLKLHADHFNKRSKEREISKRLKSEIRNFKIEEWDLITVEVRKDKGKFVNSTWEKQVAGRKIWIVIGFNDTVETVIVKTSDGLGYPIVKDGIFYEYVREVNRKLMMNS